MVLWFRICSCRLFDLARQVQRHRQHPHLLEQELQRSGGISPKLVVAAGPPFCCRQTASAPVALPTRPRSLGWCWTVTAGWELLGDFPWPMHGLDVLNAAEKQGNSDLTLNVLTWTELEDTLMLRAWFDFFGEDSAYHSFCSGKYPLGSLKIWEIKL